MSPPVRSVLAPTTPKKARMSALVPPQLGLVLDKATGEKPVEINGVQGSVVPPVPLRAPLPADLCVDTIRHGDNLALLRDLPDECVGLVVTSPPYFHQRDYGGAGIGAEATLDAYLNALLNVFAECVRVTRADGSIVFNLGDKYDEASLLLVPYRFAIAATERFGVRLVNNVTWVKQNPTPRQFRRRLVSSTEPFFHFVKSPAYFYDIDAFLAPDAIEQKRPAAATAKLGAKYVTLIEQSNLSPEAKARAQAELQDVVAEVRRGDITGFRMKIKGIHSEAFGGQEGGRKGQMDKKGFTIIRLLGNKMKRDVIESPVETLKGGIHPAVYPLAVVEEFLRLLTRPGDLVLDPFVGSGTTAVACRRLGRHYLGFDINSDYCEYARERIANSAPREDDL